MIVKKSGPPKKYIMPGPPIENNKPCGIIIKDKTTEIYLYRGTDGYDVSIGDFLCEIQEWLQMGAVKNSAEEIASWLILNGGLFAAALPIPFSWENYKEIIKYGPYHLENNFIFKPIQSFHHHPQITFEDIFIFDVDENTITHKTFP